MKKILAALLLMSVLYACTDAGEGSEVNKDSTGTNKDTMIQEGATNNSAANKDTASYERMPSTKAGDSTRH
ncbi:MAG TPA: hypothetical protein VK616_20005 [Flavitalea sp.]|nr:hypothetical protein [Flavitalea sp.]